MLPKELLQKHADPLYAVKVSRFFKHKDFFIGVRVPHIRQVAKACQTLPLEETLSLLNSPIHEERLLALLIWSIQFKKEPERIYNAYVQNIERINNWDLVDASAYQIVGAYLHQKERGILHTWAESENLWIRRIAIISTFAFIKKGELKETFRISEKLLNDKEDLIHKAMGWMLREAGKKDEKSLEHFLYNHTLPRTALRYAIEHFEESKRQKILCA